MGVDTCESLLGLRLIPVVCTNRCRKPDRVEENDVSHRRDCISQLRNSSRQGGVSLRTQWLSAVPSCWPMYTARRPKLFLEHDVPRIYPVSYNG